MTRGLQPRMMHGLALILDMDGVIVDSNPAHRQAWTLYNGRFGIETGDAMAARIFGRRNDEIVQDFFGPHLSGEEIAAHGAAKERLYREMMVETLETALVPGVRDFLEMHGRAGKALASNAEPANVQFVLDVAGLRRHFKVIVDGHQVSKPKPDPEIYFRAAELLGIAPRNCIVFEDSYSGVEAARAAGMRVVGLTTTHDRLPGVALTIPDFRAPEVHVWLQEQLPV